MNQLLDQDQDLGFPLGKGQGKNIDCELDFQPNAQSVIYHGTIFNNGAMGKHGHRVLTRYHG